MARITNKKYDYMAQSLTELLADVDKHVGKTWFANQYATAISLVPQAHAVVQTRKVREMAQFLDDKPTNELFNKCSYFENPSYYGYGNGDSESIRGLTLGEAYKAMGNIQSNFYWEDLGGNEFWMDLDRKRFVQTIQDHIEYGSAPKDLQLIENPSGRDLDSIEWGDDSIMSAEEWTRLEEYMDDNNICYNEQSDLIWHECGGFDRVTEMNIVNEIDTDHDRWNGYDADDEKCVLARLEAINDEQPLVAQLLAHKIEEVMTTTKLSFAQRYNKCDKLLDAAERQIDL